MKQLATRAVFYPMLQKLAIIFLTFTLAVPAFAQSDEESLRTLVEKYFEAYGRKDWSAMTAFWHKDSKLLGRRYEALSRQYADGELRFSELTISRIKIEDDKATLRISVKRIATWPERDLNELTNVRSEMSFVKENDQWWLWNETSSLNSLLNNLTDAASDVERRKLLDDDSELVNRELLFLLVGQSDRAYTQANYSRALNLLQSVVLVAERVNNRNELANTWHNIGIIHFVQNRFTDALNAYGNSLKLEEEIGRKPETARSLNSIALVYLAQTRFADALSYFQRALVMYESLDRKFDVAQTLENLGNLYYEQGDYARSAEYYDQSVKQLDAVKRPVQAAHRVLKIARVEFEQGHDAAAIELYRQAIDRLMSAGDRRSLGYAFHSLANVYYEQGDYNQALSFYNRSLLAEREAGTREGEAGALLGIGLIHSLNGNHSLALESYQQNLSITTSLNRQTDAASAWQKIGGSLFSLNRLEEALNAYQQALTLREQIGNGQETAQALLDVGLVLSARQDFVGALNHYARSRNLYEQADNSAGVAAALLNASLVHYLQGDFPKSVEIAGQSGEIAKRANEQDIFWQSRHRAGRAHYRLNDLVSARKALTEAIATIEVMRAPTSRSQQPRYYENKIAPYLAMVDVSLAEGQGNEAFNYAQRAKLRVLTGLLLGVKTRIVKTMTIREQEREQQLLNEITATNARLFREQESERPKSGRIAELKSQLQKAQANYSDFRSRLYAMRPQLKTLRGEIKPLTVEQAAPLIGDVKTALLEFVETDERVYLFAFMKARSKTARGKAAALSATLRIFVLETTRGDLFLRTSRFNQAILSRDQSADVQARELYDLLIKPAEALLSTKTQLIIAPDIVSWNLPFQALQSGVGKFLIEDFAISYTPSLTIFNAVKNTRLNASNNSANSKQPKPPTLLTIANPALGADAVERLNTALGSYQTGSMAESEKAAMAIAGLYGDGQSLLLSGYEATEDRIKKEIGNARYLHLATQVVHQEASPMFSFLAGAANAEAKDDGLIELRELLRLDLKADVVVMSESEWALPRILSNRAMTAWIWGWFVAGSRSELVGYWKTDSPETIDLMIDFHRALKDLTSKRAYPVVWQEAVKGWLSRQATPHPFYWAGFFLLGGAK